MNAQDERHFRSRWEPELEAIDEADGTPGNTPRARTSRLGIEAALLLVAIVAFLAGVALGSTLEHSGQRATAAPRTTPSASQPPLAIPDARYDGGWAGGPGPGALLRSTATTRAATHPPSPPASLRYPQPAQVPSCRTELSARERYEAFKLRQGDGGRPRTLPSRCR